VTIAGAGLVGSLLSVMLGQRGYRVTIFERRADMRREEVESGRSINLALSERGIHALKMAGLMDQVEKLLIPMRGRMLHLLDGSLEFSPYGQREHEVIYSVSRGELNSLMMTAAEVHPDVEVIFNQDCELVDFGKNELTVSDRISGQTQVHNFEIMIGADGAGSKIRQALISIAGGESSSEFLDHDYKELEIPAGPNGVHQIEREALHIWPRGGYMLIALPNLDGSFTVTLFMPRNGTPSFEQLDEPEELMAFFEQQFPDALKLIPDLKADYFNNPQGLLGTVRCHPWYYQNDGLILGDAAHAIVPFHGQGMNAGFEDCSELIRLLDKHDDDWAHVLPEFDRIRRPCANAIADMAIENYVTMRDSVLDPKFALKKELGFELEKRLPDRFMPRYSMVMFHRIPYDVAFKRGLVQAEILDELVRHADKLADVDMALAARLVEKRLSSLAAYTDTL
jgi:kynurenine 3-monooxygenase